MSNTKILKLHPKASSFQCQTSGVQLVMDQVIEFTEEQVASPRVQQAIQDGHLKEASKEELAAYKKKAGLLKANAPEEKSDEDDNDDEQKDESYVIPTEDELDEMDAEGLKEVLKKAGLSAKKLKALKTETSESKLIDLIETLRPQA